MTAMAAVAPVDSGAVIIEQSGTIAGTDTVPAGCCLLVRNTGAGVHTLVIAVNYSFDGLPIASRQIVMTAGQIQVVSIPADYGDANGRVAFSVLESLYSEVKYSVLGV